MIFRLQILIVHVLLVPVLLAGYTAPSFPFTPAAGVEGSTAVAHSDARIQSWAVRVASMDYGEEVAQEWRVPEAAIGPAEAADPGVLVLGRGGEVVLEFASFIRDGEGADFVVFENAFRDTFLELAYVEVSSDGIHFVRFPNYSYTAAPVSTYGVVDPTYVHGYGAKYRAGFGTPFDLAELTAAHAAMQSGYDRFSPQYGTLLQENFPKLDIERIRFVRLIDIPGDGSLTDCEGIAIYDPYPTFITAGFDLDAVGVLNEGTLSVVTFTGWSERYGLSPDPAADSDKDNWNQYMEYVLGSDPINPSSRPEVKMEIERAGDTALAHSLVYWRNEQAETVPLVQYKAGGDEWQLYLETGAVETLGRRSAEGVAQVRERIRLIATQGTFWARLLAETPD